MAMRAFPLPASSQLLGAVPSAAAQNTMVVLAGYSIRSTTTGIVNLRDRTASGQVLATVSLTAPATETKEIVNGVFSSGDIYCEIVSGVYVGTIWIA